MKILVLSPGIPSALNSGLGVVANAINKELSSLVDLTVVHPDNAGAFEENTIGIETESAVFSSESIARQEINISVSARLDPYHYMGSSAANKLTSEDYKTISEEIAQYTRQVINKSTNVTFDVIYAHDWVTFQTAVALKEKTGKPFVAHVHSLDYDRGAKRYRSFVFDIEKEALSKADAIIAVSKYTSAVLVKQYVVDPKKITIVHNAIQPFQIPEVKKSVPERIILFVGRLTEQKGPEIFMNIAERLAGKRKDVRFVMVGDGDLYKQLVEQSANALHAKFHFTGQSTVDEVRKLYAMADVFCMPSVSEPFGLAALEAAASGLPVLLSDHVGASEILQSSFKADPSQPETFVKQLETILEDDECVRKSVVENLEFLKELSWEKSARKIVTVFKNWAR